MNLLDKIVKTKKQEIYNLKKNKSLAQIQDESFIYLNKKRTRKNKFKQAIIDARPFALIAEIKLVSPSAGKLTELTCVDIAKSYAKSKADVISVLTDRKYFNGDILYLKLVKEICHQPIFRKDFIIDKYQIYETALAGGDAFLIIASLLTVEKVKNFINLGKDLGIESLVEVHSREDLEKALRANAEIIGVNNRNLKTMTIDLNTTEKLAVHIPEGKILISESGIRTHEDAEKLSKFGVDGFLVGTSIIKSGDAVNKINKLKGLA